MEIEGITFEPPVFNRKFRCGCDTCAMRAVSQALGMDYDNTYELMVSEGMRYGLLPNNIYIVATVLKDKFNWYDVSYIGKRRSILGGIDSITVCNYMHMYYVQNKEKSMRGYLIGIYNHIMYVKGLTIYDGEIRHGVFCQPCPEDAEELLNEPVRSVFLPKDDGEIVRYNADLEDFRQVTLFDDIHAIFIEFPIDVETVPTILYVYNVGHDAVGNPNQIGKSILGDKFGTLLTCSEIKLDDDGFRDINDGDWIELPGLITMADFIYDQTHGDD